MRRIVLFILVVCCGLLSKAQDFNYDIAPLDRSLVSCVKNAKVSVPKNHVECYTVDVVQRTQEPEKKLQKGKKKEQQGVIAVNNDYVAKLTGEQYDSNEVLSKGFTVSLWVVPFASPAAGHGFVMYPLKGRDVNGIDQSQWGMTVGKDCIRVYEKYTDEKLILEYRHNEKADFFITLVCQNNTPALYINGELVSTGIPSTYSPHPAFEGTADCPVSMKFIGKSTAFHYFPKVLTNAEIMGLYKTENKELHHVK